MKKFEFKSQPNKLDGYKIEMLNKLKEDDLFYNELLSSGFTEQIIVDNLSMFLDYQEDVKLCQNCQGLHCCIKTPRFLNFILNYDGKILERVFTPCKLKIQQQKIDNNIIFKHYTNDYEDAVLEKVVLSKPKKSIMLNCIKSFDEKKSAWLYVNGSPRNGKSYFFAALCNYYAENFGTVGFVSTPKILDELKNLAINDKRKFPELMDKLSNVQLLVLDDFGDEHKTEYVRDSLLIPLIQARIRKNVSTIFVSYFSLNDIKMMYTLNKHSEIRSRQLNDLILSKVKSETLLDDPSIY